MAIEIKVPVLPESVAEASLLDWHAKEGDSVTRDQILIELETDKVVLEVPSPSNGLLESILKKSGEVVNSGDVLAILQEGTASHAPKVESTTATPTPEPNKQLEDIGHSPAVTKLLNDHQLDANTISGSGKEGRLLKEDVLKALAEKEQKKPTEATPEVVARKSDATVEESATPVSGLREETRKPMTRLRQTIARRLIQSQQTAALLTTFNEVDMHESMQLRSRYRDEFEKQFNTRLGFMSFFVRAAALALQRIPAVNAYIDGTDLVYHHYSDIGIAVASPRGLVVPVLRNAEQKSFAEIESGIREFGAKAKSGALTVAELSGGTFTITNGGVFGSLLSTPIVNPPQSAILGMHKIQERPVAINGEVQIRPMMYLALTYDHRIIDGQEAVRFLVDIKENVENPARMLLQL